ncbi:MAG: hypothetical protein KIH65_004480 [Candidatus Uhrbacteria bacterium]|nr:hypothetical protein [Candidatus Uhrbacteria bacterium]
MKIQSIGELPTEYQRSIINEMLESGVISRDGADQIIARFSTSGDAIWRYWEFLFPGKGLEIASVLRLYHDINNDSIAIGPDPMMRGIRPLGSPKKRGELCALYWNIQTILTSGLFRLSGIRRIHVYCTDSSDSSAHSEKSSQAIKSKPWIPDFVIRLTSPIAPRPLSSYFDACEFRLSLAKAFSSNPQEALEQIESSWEQIRTCDVWHPVASDLAKERILGFIDLQGAVTDDVRAILWENYTLIARWCVFCAIHDCLEVAKELQHLIALFHEGNYLLGFTECMEPIVVVRSFHQGSSSAPKFSDD